MKKRQILLPLQTNEMNDALILSGIRLASLLDAKITFLYILDTANYAGYAAGGPVVAASTIENVKQQKERVKTHYIKILEKYKSSMDATIEFERKILEGSWVMGIVEYVRKRQPDILLLKHEEQGFIDKVLGDSNTEIVHLTDVPVWIIPEDRAIGMPGKLAYITDHRPGDLEVIKKLAGFGSSFVKEIYLIHVIEKENFDSELRKKGFSAMLAEELPGIPFTHLEVMKDRLTVDVEEFIDEHDFGMLATKNESEHFLSRFFTRSSVEKLMNSVEIPLAIYA